MVNKVGKATRLGKDMYWWYKTGKKLYDKGKDVYDQYFTNTAPLFRDKPVDFGIPVMDFYVCFNKRKRTVFGTPVLTRLSDDLAS